MHLTVRMAWHDNNWNGHVCRNPEGNTYCTGAHSLLSGRIEKKKNVEFEKKSADKPLSGLKPADIPPCFWSINTFGEERFKVEQGHAFKSIIEKIPESVGPYSFFTWPFKLSFNHSKEKKGRQGSYPADLEKRIENFAKKFTPKKSIVFFYANYDNPVSADDMKYLLLGCSVLSASLKRTWFPFSDDVLKQWRSRSESLKNFPKINWALLCSHDPQFLMLLPYREYVEYAEKNPNDEEKLEQMRVVIEEESLIRAFKYVAMDIDDDKTLYLLYKLRKAIKRIQEHEQLVIKSDLAREEKLIDNLIEMVWKERGIYPSLSHVLNFILEDKDASSSLAEALRDVASPEKDLAAIFVELAEGKTPKELKTYADELNELMENHKFKKNYRAFCKLSLFNLTLRQVEKIAGNDALLKGIEWNPYLLYEEYEVSDPKDQEKELDTPDLVDEPIDIYKIDVGMIPDRKFVKRHRGLQNLSEDSPERLRSVIVNYLLSIGTDGHCYDTIDSILDDIQEHPLIYKNDIKIDVEAIRKPEHDYKSHFVERLVIKTVNETQYYYLTEIHKAELQIKEWIESLLNRNDHGPVTFDQRLHIASSISVLKDRIPQFDEEQFKTERQKLFGNVFQKSLFLITGRPGSGKTWETSKIVEVLRANGESVVILAPTGKAVLRLRELLRRDDDENTTVETIDRFICGREFRWAYDDWERLDGLADKDKIVVDNLILDESSMLDLEKLKVLTSIMRRDAQYPRRVILVGDENQLPPIGIGKPFHDIIVYLWSNEELVDKHYVHLQSNCRQENDQNILTLAEAFTDKKRYYEEALELVRKDGKVSEGLFIYHWVSKDDLEKQILDAVRNVTDIELAAELKLKSLTNIQQLNKLFGLYENGYVNNKDYGFQKRLTLDKLQLLSPYRPGYYGTMGANALVQSNYREKKSDDDKTIFYHSDKIICHKNVYRWANGKVDLILSNGSIGVVAGDEQRRKFYFPEHKYPLSYLEDEDNYDLSYCITVHKSQGSDFRNVLLVIPNKLTLLSKELIYTALTRSRFRLFVFVQQTHGNLFAYARGISHLLSRRTSMFEDPEDKKKKYYPEKGGKPVQSKNEYIIYTALRKNGLQFDYEKALKLQNLPYEIHPDFTIVLPNDQRIYWEHLGMLDTRKYYRDWQERKRHYEEHGMLDNVISTDDLEGLKNEKLQLVIDQLKEGSLRDTRSSRFSNHHYELY